ncbi:MULTISPECIES: cytochrome c oxidase assembly protein [unclassified Sphingobium]|uniref:cytochrome c oxidase assembly protein n=1 Tax=unclassified Sphingobium TaxID=2611147 RepID=UPI002224E6D2|nr:MULTISPECIES: cytochrome c oxidase assembly protein [unclassified Sphingobium]MCW2382346.1 cytochrome c oxidase assembly protein subunit 11 [Sphingobium sp. B2D3B]MCW2387451.1 cytochrome c oxidase assembly protein subunit 11 [Sphingobium sp. B11D3B]MCW2397481.1 cytochrome c oxidase assembly protein subunit 11 [Sphingobium sp. B2D3C]
MTTIAGKRVSNRKTALLAALVAVAMLGLGFAAVPLYRLFCQVTGFGGTTQRVDAAEAAKAVSLQTQGRQLSIRFDSNIGGGIPWEFYPEKRRLTVGVGGKSMAIFIAKNTSNKPVTGRAVFNVTPEYVGKYFSKVQCFCFTEQTLQPGQQVRMPVLFYVDKAFLDDSDGKDVQEITLSYTFYPVEKPDDQS